MPGQYIFQEQSSGDPPSVQITGPALDRPLSPTGTNDTLLSPGVYSIRFEAPADGPAHVHLFFRLSSDQTEIFLANGVGQGPALSLRLITYSEDTVTPPSVAHHATGPWAVSDGASGTDSQGDDRFPSLDPPPARFVPIPRPCEVSRSQVHRPPRLRSWAWEAIWSGAPPSQPLVRRLRSGRLSSAPIQGASTASVPGQSLKALPTGPARFLWESRQFDRRESRGRSGKTACPGNHDRLRSSQGQSRPLLVCGDGLSSKGSSF